MNRKELQDALRPLKTEHPEIKLNAKTDKLQEWYDELILGQQVLDLETSTQVVEQPEELTGQSSELTTPIDSGDEPSMTVEPTPSVEQKSTEALFHYLESKSSTTMKPSEFIRQEFLKKWNDNELDSWSEMTMCLRYMETVLDTPNKANFFVQLIDSDFLAIVTEYNWDSITNTLENIETEDGIAFDPIMKRDQDFFKWLFSDELNENHHCSVYVEMGRLIRDYYQGKGFDELFSYYDKANMGKDFMNTFFGI